MGETGGEKNTSRKKTAKPHKKALKGETGAGRETTGGGRDRRRRLDSKRTRTRMRRRWRRKSCGHGCTERDSGCRSTCPFSRELRRVVIYGNKEWVGRKTRDARRPCRVSPASDSVERQRSWRSGYLISKGTLVEFLIRFTNMYRIIYIFTTTIS